MKFGHFMQKMFPHVEIIIQNLFMDFVVPKRPKNRLGRWSTAKMLFSMVEATQNL